MGFLVDLIREYGLGVVFLNVLEHIEDAYVEPDWRKPVGCVKCQGTGYRGRLGIYEMVPVTERMQHLIVSGASVNDMKALAREEGCRFLRDDGLLKAWQGLTTVEEVLRVAGS